MGVEAAAINTPIAPIMMFPRMSNPPIRNIAPVMPSGFRQKDFLPFSSDIKCIKTSNILDSWVKVRLLDK